MSLPERSEAAVERAAERPSMSPRVEALLRTDGVAMSALFAFRSLLPEEVMTSSGIFYGLLAAQGLDYKHRTEEGDPIEEGWVMDKSTPLSWYKPIATEETDVVIPAAEGGYLISETAEPTVLSTVPLVELIAQSEFSQTGLFGRSPATRLALFKGIVALAGESTGDVTFTAKQLVDVSGVADANTHLVTLRYLKLLDYVSSRTNGDSRYVHYRLAAGSSAELPIQHKDPALHALATQVYEVMHSRIANERGLTISTITASLISELLPLKYQEMPIDELEDAVAGVIKRWRDKRPERDGQPAMVQYGEGTFTRDQQSTVTITAAHVEFLRNLVAACDTLMAVDAGGTVRDSELEAWAQRSDSLLKNQALMRTIFGKAHRDSFKAESLSSSEMARLVQTILAENATDPLSPPLKTAQIWEVIVQRLRKNKDLRYVEQVLSQLEEEGEILGERTGKEQYWILPGSSKQLEQSSRHTNNTTITSTLIADIMSNTFSLEGLLGRFPTSKEAVLETVADFLQKGYLQKTVSGRFIPTQVFNNFILSKPPLLIQTLQQMIKRGQGAVSDGYILACAPRQFGRFVQVDADRIGINTQAIVPLRMTSVVFPPELRIQVSTPREVAYFIKQGISLDNIKIVLPFNVGVARPTVRQGEKENVSLTQLFQACTNLLAKSFSLANLHVPEDMVAFVAENVFGLSPDRIQRPDRRQFFSS